MKRCTGDSCVNTRTPGRRARFRTPVSGKCCCPWLGEGYPLGVLSNKPHAVTVPLVRHILPEIPFREVMGFSERFPRKPEPDSLLSIVRSWGREPAQVCMVGDSAHDGNTAVNAGTRLVLVGWGYSSRSALDAFRVPVCAAAGELSARLHDESSLPFPVAAHKNS